MLCSTRGGERRGACAFEHQVVLCSTRENGGEQGGCALQRQGRGEEKGSCFGAPDCALQHQGGWGGRGGLCFAAPHAWQHPSL